MDWDVLRAPFMAGLCFRTGTGMHPEIKQNFKEKLSLTTRDQIALLGEKFEEMLRLHAATGRLGSGDTIKRTMEFVAEGNANLYRVGIVHLDALKLEYYPQIEEDVLDLVGAAQEPYKSASLTYFKKSTEHARNPKLYDRLLPDVESEMAAELANFQNTLNATALYLKLSNQMSPLVKALWGIEAVLLLASMFIAGMWLKDPTGNYEPVLVGLGLVMPLIAIGIKYSANKST